MSDELIARLEAATKGSRELDAHLDAAMNARVIHRIEPSCHPAYLYTPGRYWYDLVHFADSKNYTTSLDAALPGEQIIKTEIDAEGWQATALTADGGSVYGFGKTEALARRIAALKARAASDKPAKAVGEML